MTSADNVQYSGSYGTTMTRWLSIQRDGFNVNSGLRGTGAYFWEKSVYARELAIAWYIRTKRRGDYSSDKDNKCVVIWADFKVDPDEVADYTAREMRNYVLELIKKLGYADENKQACKIYDLVVERVEELLGAPIKLVITTVQPPNKPRWYPTQTFGPAHCYAVRDVDCININSTEVLKHFDAFDKEECFNVLQKENVLYGGKNEA